MYCMKNNDNNLVSSCFEYVSYNANSILENKITYLSNLNKAINQNEQVYVMSSEEKSLIDRIWSLIQKNLISIQLKFRF